MKSRIQHLLTGLFIAFGASATADAPVAPLAEPRIAVTIRQSSMWTKQWSERVCQQISGVVQDIEGYKSIETHCFAPQTQKDYDAVVQQQVPGLAADYHFEVSFEIGKKIRVAVTKLDQKDKSIIDRVGWVFNDKGSIPIFANELKDQLTKSLPTFDRVHLVKDALMEVVLEDNGVQVKNLSSQEKYQAFMALPEPEERKKQYLMAATELIVTAGAGFYKYSQEQGMSADWDYVDAGFLGTVKNKLRLGNMVRYDDNGFGINTQHTQAGFLYYTTCRGNNFTALQSYLCSVAGSTAWEMITEWREVLSINDQIFTAHGGAIVGEAVHQMGEYIFAKGPKWLRNSVGYAWNGPKAVNDWANTKLFNGQMTKFDTPTDITGKFEVEVGVARYGKNGTLKRFALSNEVVRVPLVEEAGSSSGLFMDVAQTDLQVEGPMPEFGAKYELFAKTVWAAYQQRRIKENANGVKDGYSFFIGPSSAFTLKNSDPTYKDDFMGIVHVLGTSMRMINFYKGVRITTTFDIWGDAVMMHSQLFEKYDAEVGLQGLVHTISSNQYYHGVGATFRGQMAIDLTDRIAIGADFSITGTENTNWRQRDSSALVTDVTRTIDARDSVADVNVFVDAKLNDSFKIRARVGRYYRGSTIQDFGSIGETETRASVSIIYYF